ncbi:MAG: hypothetical protein JST86_15060 [Bacteroidetes bacterium]|nr:hypothetical protein [Bacteroidota bacterium]
MKKILLLLAVSLLTTYNYAQSLSQVSLSGGGIALSSFSFTTDQQAIIRISPDGNIIDWGMALEPTRIGYYQGKLQPFMGRVDYYGQEADEAYRGKVKSIGTCNITYYGASQPATQKGKVKSIGSVQLDYYMEYDNDAFRGKLKSINGSAVEYYASYDNESFRGKLKSVTGTALTYYSQLDDRLNKGKIKSIGTVSYSWYGEFDRKEYQGSMKSGSTIQKINGITFSIW